MKVKTNGAEFKRFYSDPTYWPDGTWHDDDYITVDGDFDIERDFLEMADEVAVVIESGYVIGPNDEDFGSLASYFNRWKKEQTTVTVLVDLPRGKEAELAALVKQIGGKVVA